MGVYASKSITYNISGEFSYTVPELYNGNGNKYSNLTDYIAWQLNSDVSKFNSIKFTGTKPEVADGTPTIDVGYNYSTRKFNNSYVAYCTLNSTNSMYDIVIYSKIGNKFVLPQNSAYMFCYCSNLTTLDVSKFDTSNVTDMKGMFYGCSSLTSLDLSSFDTSNVTNLSAMFYGCSNLTNINISSFRTPKLERMAGMFFNCSSLASLDLSNFDTSNVITMCVPTSETVEQHYGLFSECENLGSIIFGDNFSTSQLTYMNSMFYNCSKLTSLDLSKFDTSNVTDMSCMFSGCSGLTSLDLSKFNTSNVTNMSNMFASCSKLTDTGLNVGNFNTSNVTMMDFMFYECSGLTSLDVSNFNTSKVTNMYSMFYKCSSLESLNLSSFDLSKVTLCYNFLDDCTVLTKIETPKIKPGTINIHLPSGTWTDDAGNPYTKMPTTTGTSITLTKTA